MQSGATGKCERTAPQSRRRDRPEALRLVIYSVIISTSLPSRQWLANFLPGVHTSNVDVELLCHLAIESIAIAPRAF